MQPMIQTHSQFQVTTKIKLKKKKKIKLSSEEFFNTWGLEIF